MYEIEWTMFHGHLDYFQKPHLFKGRPNAKLGDHGTLKAHNSWFSIFYHVWGPCMNRNSMKQHLIEGLGTYDFTLHSRARDHMTWFWKCLGTAFGQFLLGSRNSMVTDLVSCVTWPYDSSQFRHLHTHSSKLWVPFLPLLSCLFVHWGCTASYCLWKCTIMIRLCGLTLTKEALGGFVNDFCDGYSPPFNRQRTSTLPFEGKSGNYYS